MIKVNFPMNDLRRRPFQTSITIITLTLSVASTLFLLIFSTRLGIGAASVGTLTLGLTAIFSQFILFIGALIFVIGTVLTAFVSFLAMTQRTRDFGLIKAVGCPNSLVGGYYMAELLTTTIIGCFLGVALGFLIDYLTAVVIFSSYSLPNFWFAPLIFTVFFILAFVFGIQPIIKAAKMSPLQALSPVNYYGLTSTSHHKALSHSALIWKVATRSLARRQSASIMIVFLLSIVFVLLTVTVAGGIIASETTESWVQMPIDKDILVIAHNSMGNQYVLLLEKFSGAKETTVFNYSDQKLAIPQAAINQLKTLPSVSLIDSRLVLSEHVKEISNFTVDPETGVTYSVGDSRQGESLVVGVDSPNLAGSWFVKGRFLDSNDSLAAVVADGVVHTMYSASPSGQTRFSDPLLEAISFENNTYDIVGVCVDPINNGFVTYVPIKQLMGDSGISSPNLLLVKLNSSNDRAASIEQIRTSIQTIDPDLNVFTLEDTVSRNTAFLMLSWRLILFLPIFTLASATFCLVGYMMLSVSEQRHEFAVLRAVGAKPKVILIISAIQSLLVLLCSFGTGLVIGIIITLTILMRQPLVTGFTIIEIATWLFSALVAMFLLSLYPVFRVAKSSILKIMT